MLLSADERAAALAFYVDHPEVAAALPLAFVKAHGPFGGVKMVEAVAAFQAAHGLQIDGKAGPRETLPALQAIYLTETAAEKPRADALRFRGRYHEVPGVRVVNPSSPEGYDFGRYPGHTKGPMKPGYPTAVLLHDSVTRTTDACFQVLLKRKNRKTGKSLGLSTALMLSPSGTLYQCVEDLTMATRHAGGGWNGVAVGLDVIALLDPALAPKSPLRRPATSWAPGGYLDYTPEQRRALASILQTLAHLLQVPYDCPRDPSDGRPAYRKASEALTLNPKEFRGIVAHGQVSPARWDGQVALQTVFEA